MQTSQAGLRASRPRSLWFRLRFVFPVCHWFPVVVSQYFNRASLTLGPSQIRTCGVTASGSQTSLGNVSTQAGNESTAQSLNGGVHTTLGTAIASGILRARIMMRSSRVSTDFPSLSTVGARTELREIPTAFPTPILLGLSPSAWSAECSGTMRSSDSLGVICLRRLFHF